MQIFFKIKETKSQENLKSWGSIPINPLNVINKNNRILAW